MPEVDYSYYPARKAVSVPLAAGKTARSGGFPARAPAEAVLCDDFSVFGSDGQRRPAAPTEMRLWRDGEFLCLDIACFEPGGKIVAGVREDGMGIWHDDLVEIFFGSLSPEPWLLQLAVSAGGARFDSTGEYGSWSARVAAGRGKWRAAARVPLARLPAVNGGFGFNLCRQSLSRGELSVWSPLKKRFHEVENFGTLLLCDYGTAFFLRTNRSPGRALSRPEYEEMIARASVRAEKVTHGPYLTCPAPDSVCVNWNTAGKLPGILEYRKKGARRFTAHRADARDGIMLHRELHFAPLSGLEPDTEYEYRTRSLSPVLYTPSRPGRKYSFRTLSDRKKEFSFACCADIHSHAARFRKAVSSAAARRSDFFVVLGDSLSHMAGRDALLRGVIDPAADTFATRKPLVFVRGNHDQLGVFAGEYFNCLRHPTGRTFYTFRHGAVFFVVLDFGNDAPDDALFFRNAEMRAQEREWLEGVVASPGYREADFRIVFAHIPPCLKEAPTHAAGQRLITGLLDSTRPEKRVHLMFCGHIHDYLRKNPGAESPAVTARRFPGPAPMFSHPFTLVVNGSGAQLEATVSRGAISVRARGIGGGTIDSFRVGRDGALSA